jgi:ATP phosphoribosyltransferase
MITLAVQKSGRLHDDSIKLLKECGIKLNNGVKKLKANVENFPMEIFYLRDDDIPQYVEDGVADLGIVGENVLAEKGSEVSIAKVLGFAKCRLSLAVPRAAEYTGLDYFNNKSIATSYRGILTSYLQKNGVEAEIHDISGSVEIAPGIGLADGICDLVSTGSTLFMNGLKEVETIFRSEAVLVKNHSLSKEKEEILEQLIFRINAVQKAKDYKYILLNLPNDKIDRVSSLIPGMKSPTVVPLAKEGWSSVHSVVSEDDFWQSIENLKKEGAEGILVIPIEKMIV